MPAAYDSMIAKAIAHAPTRDEAMDALAEALRAIEIWPVASNAALLANLLDHPEAREGRATTNLVEADIEEVAKPDDMEFANALVLGAAGLQALAANVADPWSTANGFRLNAPARATFTFDVKDEPHVVRLETGDDGLHRAEIDGERFDVQLSLERIPGGVLVGANSEGGDAVGVVRNLAAGPVLFTDGWAIPLAPPEFSHALDAVAGGDDVRAPMPGKVLEVKAVAGADVKKGAPLIVLEAMKMEHTLTAPRDGRIAEVSAVAGAQTADGVVLVRLEPIPE